MAHKPGALLISAGGSLIHSLHLAQLLIQRGGAIATVPDVMRYVLENPDAVSQFGGHVTTGSGVYFMRDKRGSRRMFRGIVSHEDGPHTNPELLKSGWAAARPETTFPLAHLDGASFSQVVHASKSFPIHLPTEIVERKSKRGQGRYRIDFYGVYRQSRALLGRGYRELVDLARTVKIKPEQFIEKDGTQKRNSDYDVWRNGSVAMFLGFFSGEEQEDFQGGAYALMSPMSVLFHEKDVESRGTSLSKYIFTAGYTSNGAPPLLVWLDAKSRGGTIVRDPKNIAMWKLDQGDEWVHPNEEVSSSTDLFLLGVDETGKRPDVLLSPCNAWDGTIQYSGDPVAVVESKRLLGSRTRDELVFAQGLLSSDVLSIRDEAPEGANAFLFFSDDETEECGEFGHMTTLKNVRVDYYNVTPTRKNRYLTANEIVSQHERYLDTVLMQL